MNFCQRTFLKYDYDSFATLVLKYCMNQVSIYFYERRKTWESLATLPAAAAGEALPWKLSRFGPECAHVPLFTVLIVLFSRLVQGRELSFLVTQQVLRFFFFVYCSVQCLYFFFILKFSVQSHVFRGPGTGNVFGRIMLSFLWNCWYNDGDD